MPTVYAFPQCWEYGARELVTARMAIALLMGARTLGVHSEGHVENELVREYRSVGAGDAPLGI